MKIAVAGGVTGGHIYPAVALIQKFQEIHGDTEVLYFATPHGLENREIKRLFAHATIVQLPVRGLERPFFDPKNLSIMMKALHSVSNCKKWIRQFKPDLTLITGGYVSVPVGIASRRCKVPYYIHEQNAIGGLANRWIARHARKVFISFEESRKDFPSKAAQIIFSGNPVRKRCEGRGKLLQRLGLDPQRPVILVVGGSQGSGFLNETMQQVYRLWHRKDFQFLHSTGDSALTDKLKSFPHVFPLDFIEDMHECMADCAMMISRAGATSVAEMVNFQIPSLIIPWSKAAENHQLRNAQALFQQGGALYLEENEASAEAILKKIDELLDTNRHKQMRQALKKMQPAIDPTESIYTTILKDLGA